MRSTLLSYAMLVASILAVLFVVGTQAKKVMLMQNFDPEKIQGVWYVLRRNTKLFDAVKCVKFEMKHDEKLEDVYAMTAHWLNSKGEYEETHFNIVDDRSLKSRFFFESSKDKVALSIMGTSYDSYVVGFGVNGDKDTYFVATRSLTQDDSYKGPVEELLKKNEVDRDWHDIDHTGCPAEH